VLGNKLNLKNDFLEKIGINHQHDNPQRQRGVGSLQSHAQNLLYLQSLGVTDIGKVVTRLPQILSYSIEDNLQPNVEYLTNQCYVTIRDIEQNPNLVSYSLDKRVKPRHTFLQTKGIEVGYDITVGTMLKSNDRRFAKTAKSDYDEWMSFKEDYLQKANW